ncbi:MAG: hypothetical protein A3G27_16970 [Betaproteobacteria bacterium RIFCSPLOWO2_12_FULL_66_14]|nr:MAG: hypothetical protein A3G27_16970 [Betaproteobacteria bacterium RIFCSPLOWO2_12_FULL_66_14]
MKSRAKILLGTAAAALLALSISAYPQAFPSKPIRIVTQFNPGSSGDVVIRTVAEEWSKIAGQPVVIENRAGGGGMVAAVLVAHAAPDGYTTLAGTSSMQVTRKFLSKSMDIDPGKDLIPITKVGQSLTVFSVNASVPVDSMKELIEYAKRNPGKIAYGTSGIGSEHHLSGEQIKQITGIDLLHVPYKASSAALLDVVSGQLTSTFSIYAVTAPHIKSRKVKTLAVVRDQRFNQLPNVPTMAEVVQGFEQPPSWTGLFGPAGIPQPILRRLNNDVVKAMGVPEMQAKLAVGGFELEPTTPEGFAAQIKRQTDLVARIVKAAGIKPE